MYARFTTTDEEIQTAREMRIRTQASRKEAVAMSDKARALVKESAAQVHRLRKLYPGRKRD